MPGTWETLTVDGSTMETYVAVPKAGGPAPGVVVVQHASGVDRFITDFCERLSANGLVAAAPDLYHRQEDLPFRDLGALDKADLDRWPTMMRKAGAMRDDEIERDVTAVTAYLRAHPDVSGSDVGITGFCGGGRVAYMMAGRDPNLGAAAIFHGGFILAPRGDFPAAIDLTPTISCPVAGFFGDDDENPSKEDVTAIARTLEEHGKAYAFTSYPGTGHSFLDFTNERAFRPDPAADAFVKLLGFLAVNLKTSA